jgi:conjugative transfer signal peptidase TraF
MSRVTSTRASMNAGTPRSHRRPLRAGLLACAGAALGLLLLPAVHRPQLRLLWNASASVPLGLYRIEPGAPPRVGDLVALRPSPALGRFMATRRYVETNALLIKPVAAVSGATICRIGTRVTINTRPVVSALPQDRFGRPLPTWSGCDRLRANQLFLIAPAHADSFDSRYFGPVERRAVVGRALPLSTWS